MPYYEHGVINVNIAETNPILEMNAESKKPPKDNINECNVLQDFVQDEDGEDYSYHILKLDHFKKGTNYKDKNIIQEEDLETLINQKLDKIINESYKL